jgi:hypothetical protein
MLRRWNHLELTGCSELEGRAFKLVHFRNIAAQDNHPNRNDAIDAEAELLNWFNEQFDDLVSTFG